MAIELAYINLVIPIRNIEKYYLGGFVQYKKDNESKMEHDDYLVMKSAMTMEEIESFAKECEEFGLVGVVEKQGIKYWQDFCIVDIISTLPCEWLEHDGTAVYHIDDQAYIAELEALPIEDRIIQILYIHGYGGEGNSISLFDKLAKTDLLILDDFGLTTMDNQQQLDLMEIIEDRHARKSTIIASQLPVASWFDVFKEETLADAILDRIVHTAHRFELKGESLRKKR